ncbi:MAG: ChaB family protein [Candidatus Competibacteraceae bacterium]
MYTQLSELPPSIREELPELAQELYRVSYNRAIEKNRASETNMNEADLAETAHKLAWRKVLEEYQKDEQGGWRQNPIDEYIDKDKIRHT